MIVEVPLTKANRLRMARAFAQQPRVDIGIECALEGQMGRAFSDDGESPAVYRIEQGPFWYLTGDTAGQAAREMLVTLPQYALLMAPRPAWVELGRELYGDRLVGFPRYSFSAGALSVEHLERLAHGSPFQGTVQRIDVALATQFRDDPRRFVDLSSFDSPEDFVERGIGFCVLGGQGMLGVAYSSLVCSRGIEVSTFVVERHRRRGVATMLACALLTHCLAQGLEPHWDAANAASCRLAEKLGYLPEGTYQAYCLAG